MSLHLSAEDYGRLASLGVVERNGVLTTESGREVSPGTAVSLLQKALTSDYPDVQVHFAQMPPPESFDRSYLQAGHAAENATSYTTGTPTRGAVGVIAERERERAEHDRPEAWDQAYKRRGKRKGPRHPGEQAEQAAADEGPRTHVETVKAVTPHPSEFQRGYLRAGHQAQSPAVTGVRGTVGLPPSNDAVAEPQGFIRGWLTQNHQERSPGDEPGNNPNSPYASGHDVYDSASASYNANRSASTAEHISSTGRASSEPAVARWEPSPALGAANMPQPVSTASLPIARAPGE